MEKKFQKSFSKVVKKEDTLILAVSGWVDSMVLLDLVSKHHAKEKIIVVHFDHSLRGEESDGDREFVVEYARAHDLKSETEKLDIAKLAKDEKKSVENVARHYRYEFLTEVAKKYGAKYILTAHHGDDRIETAVFNLIRGTKLGGIHALASLKYPKSKYRLESVLYFDPKDIPEVTGIIFRPLLSLSKEGIVAYANEHHLPFREDSTNIDTRYQRNYMRHEVLPRFEYINPEYRQALSNFIDYSEELKSWIDGEVEKFLGEKKEFSAFEFAKQPPFFQKEIIRYIYEKANNGTVGLSEGSIEEIQRFVLMASGWTEKSLQNLILKKRNQKISFL
jgi:tRNA(Ile)-lysidine synthase